MLLFMHYASKGEVCIIISIISHQAACSSGSHQRLMVQGMQYQLHFYQYKHGGRDKDNASVATSGGADWPRLLHFFTHTFRFYCTRRINLILLNGSHDIENRTIGSTRIFSSQLVSGN